MNHKTRPPVVSVFLLSAATVAYAADNLPAVNPAVEDVRDAMREMRTIENMRKEDAAWTLQQNRTVETSETKQQEETTPSSETHPAETCLQYNKVTLDGITFIDSKIFEQKLTKCVSENSLNQLSREIVAAYIKKGYPHTSIKFIENEDNTLIVKVQEGRIREITGNSRKVNINTLFPKNKNHPLSIDYLDQGIEQANKLIGNNVTMDIYPHEDGSATVALKNQESKAWTGSVTVDNRGSKPNEAVMRLQGGIDSPAGLSDSLYLGAYSNIRQGNSHYSRGANLYYTVPYGAWTFSTYGGLSRSQSMIEFQSGTKLAYRSKTVTAGVKGERVFSRGRKHISYGYAGVDYLNTVVDFGGSRLELQSPKLGTFQAGVSHSLMLDSGIWTNDVNIEVGTGAFGAEDKPQSPFTSRYTRFSFQSNLTQSHRAGKWLLRNRHRLAAQYSAKDLYSTKQFSVSDRSGVRGFKNLALNGNSGVSLNNTVYARRQSATGMYVEPYMGADWGVAKDNDSRYTGYGVAAGLNIGYKNHWHVSLESARGFLRAKNGNKAREEQITASFRMSF